MSDHDAIAELLARIEKAHGLLEKLSLAYEGFLAGDFKLLGKKNTSAMVLAEFMVDYYTCLEICFFRISQLFENRLAAERWHLDLLENPQNCRAAACGVP